MKSLAYVKGARCLVSSLAAISIREKHCIALWPAAVLLDEGFGWAGDTRIGDPSEAVLVLGM